MIKRALISVFDKTGIVELAKELDKLGEPSRIATVNQRGTSDKEDHAVCIYGNYVLDNIYINPKRRNETSYRFIRISDYYPFGQWHYIL